MEQTLESRTEKDVVAAILTARIFDELTRTQGRLNALRPLADNICIEFVKIEQPSSPDERKQAIDRVAFYVEMINTLAEQWDAEDAADSDLPSSSSSEAR